VNVLDFKPSPRTRKALAYDQPGPERRAAPRPVTAGLAPGRRLMKEQNRNFGKRAGVENRL